jgi:hypothetical protein
MGYKDLSYHDFKKILAEMESEGAAYFDGAEESKNDEGENSSKHSNKDLE